MNPTPFRLISLILLAGLIFGCSGCLPTGDPATQLSPTATKPAGTPAADWFKTSMSRLIEGVLIEEIKTDEIGITITWWELDGNGFPSSQWMNSRVDPGDEKPRWFQASPADRQKIMASWRAKGFDARITGTDGKVSEVSNLFLRYDPPLSYQWSVPARLAKTSFDLMVNGTKKTIDFNSAAKLEIKGGDLIVTLRDGSQLTGSYLPPSYNSNPYRPNFYGVQYGADGRVQRVEVALEATRMVEWLSWKGK